MREREASQVLEDHGYDESITRRMNTYIVEDNVKGQRQK